MSSVPIASPGRSSGSAGAGSLPPAVGAAVSETSGIEFDMIVRQAVNADNDGPVVAFAKTAETDRQVDGSTAGCRLNVRHGELQTPSIGRQKTSPKRAPSKVGDGAPFLSRRPWPVYPRLVPGRVAVEVEAGRQRSGRDQRQRSAPGQPLIPSSRVRSLFQETVTLRE